MNPSPSSLTLPATGTGSEIMSEADRSDSAAVDQELEKEHRMRFCVIKEIVETEKTYLENLEFMTNVSTSFVCTSAFGSFRRFSLFPSDWTNHTPLSAVG